MVLLKGRHQRGLHFESIKGVLFQIYIVFAEVCAGKCTVKCRCPLRLHPASFFRVNVADDSGNSIGRTIHTAYHLRRCPEPLVLAILHFQSVLNIIFCSIGFVRNRFQKQLHYPVMILRVQKVRPRIQFVRKIQNVMISKDLPERMAPVHIDDFTVFIALKIPQRRMNGFVD